MLIRILGGWLGYELSKVDLGEFLFSIFLYKFSFFFGSMWFIPYVFVYGVSLFPLNYGYVIIKSFDSGWREFFGGQGLFWFFSFLAKGNQWLQYGSLRVYIFFIVVWVNLLVFFMFMYLNSLFRA